MQLTEALSYTQKVLRQHWTRYFVSRDIARLMRDVSRHVYLDTKKKPIVLFNASTRLTGLSQNAAFSLLTGLGLQLAGIPVVHFACQAGMSRCVLGTDRDQLEKKPPCQACIAQSRWLYMDAPTIWFRYQKDQRLAEAIEKLNLEQLIAFEWSIQLGKSASATIIQVGALVLPALRWVMRRHHLSDDPSTRTLFREYILSAYRIAQEFNIFLSQIEPGVVVVFNGMFFPEATARWVAKQHGLAVVTHEVGLQPFSAFFTTGEATAYPLQISDKFELSSEQNKRLDKYLSRRFQGNFSMAGIQFWPQMRGLDEGFVRLAARFKQLVPVFTNVIFDTSQPHSNIVFPHMFAWLDLVLEIARCHPETLFVLRAHPDENRPGKESRESVRQWVELTGAATLPNMVFFDSGEYVSSYQLIQMAKFVMIYNSTIGLEASIMGVPVLCAGRARFTQLPTVYFPNMPDAYKDQLEEFLNAETVARPSEFQHNARRFLYYQLFISSLPFEEFLQPDGVWPGFVRLKKFDWQRLTPQNSPAMWALVNGMIQLGDMPRQESVGEHNNAQNEALFMLPETQIQ